MDTTYRAQWTNQRQKSLTESSEPAGPINEDCWDTTQPTEWRLWVCHGCNSKHVESADAPPAPCLCGDSAIWAAHGRVWAIVPGIYTTLRPFLECDYLTEESDKIPYRQYSILRERSTEELIDEAGGLERAHERHHGNWPWVVTARLVEMSKR